MDVEAGAPDGSRVLLEGEGDVVPGKEVPGDIIIVFQQKPHQVYTRTDMDLDVTLEVLF